MVRPFAQQTKSEIDSKQIPTKSKPTPIKGRELVPEAPAIRRSKGTSVATAYPKADRIDIGRKNNDWDLSDLYSPRANYTVEEKLAATTAYVLTGTALGASRLTGISNKTISDWKLHASWWPDAYRAVKIQKQEEMDGIMTSIIHFAGEELIDRLCNGDEVLTKDGDIRMKKLTGKDVAWILAIIHDKRALLRGDPTSRQEKVDTNKLLDQMAKKFEDMGRAKVINEEPNELS